MKVTGDPIDERYLAYLLEHHYRTRLIAAKPVNRSIKVKTEQGEFLLKRLQSEGEKRWKLLQEIAEYSSEKKGKQSIPTPVQTMQGKISFAAMHGKYILLPWINGDLITFTRGKHWRRTARAMAEMHQGSGGFVPSRTGRAFEHAGNWSFIWQHLFKQIDGYDASSSADPVDQAWMRQRSYTAGMLETALKYLEKAGGDALCQELRREGSVCHGNIRVGHVIRDEQKHMHFLSWDQAVLDIRSRDIAHLLNYAFRKTGESDIISTILYGYQQISPLKEPEYALIYTRLLFPDSMIRRLDQIYRQRRFSPQKAVKSFASSARKEEMKTKLLKEFPSIVKKEFGVLIPEVDWLSPNSE